MACVLENFEEPEEVEEGRGPTARLSLWSGHPEARTPMETYGGKGFVVRHKESATAPPTLSLGTCSVQGPKGKLRPCWETELPGAPGWWLRRYTTTGSLPWLTQSPGCPDRRTKVSSCQSSAGGLGAAS